MTDTNNESVYYQHSGRVPLASKISYMARQRMFNRFMEVMKPTDQDKVLDIGVTNDTSFRESNYFEQFYPYKTNLVCVGTEDGSHLANVYPGVTFMKVEPGAPLPFPDLHFEIVFSNAVIEHVGDMSAQKAFIAEACRVSRRVFITTPNRWFPVEHHTGVPLLHYLPKPIYRWLLGKTKLNYWASVQHLNLLTRQEFSELFPQKYPVQVERVGVGYGPWLSNLIAYSSAQK